MAGDAKQQFEVDEDPAFMRRWWTVQRVAWVVFAVLIGLALLGLTGAGGLLDKATASSASGLAVEHPRVMRQDADDELRISVQTPPAGTVDVTLAGDLFDVAELQSMVPEPDTSEESPRGVVYTFRVPEGAGDLDIALHLQASSWGYHDASVAVDDGAPAEFDVVVLP